MFEKETTTECEDDTQTSPIFQITRYLLMIIISVYILQISLCFIIYYLIYNLNYFKEPQQPQQVQVLLKVNQKLNKKREHHKQQENVICHQEESDLVQKQNEKHL